MKKMKYFVVTAMIATMLSPVTALAAEGQEVMTEVEVENEVETETSPKITPRKDHIDWRYKIMNGRTYKRLYNYSRDYWIGVWEPVQ